MADSGSTHMRREVSLVHATSVMTGVIIGSGIFVSPIAIINNSGSVAMSLIMWVLSGVLSLFVALCYSELGAIFPRSGGEYTFFKQIIGPLPAFVDVWHQLILIQPSFQALLALTTTDYIIQAIFPNSCAVPTMAVRLLTVWFLVTIVALNSVYVRYVARTQTVLTILKLMAIGVIIVTGLVQLAYGKTDHLKMGFANTNVDLGGQAVAIQAGIFTYMGWEYLFCLMEEVENPTRIVPRATVISIGTVTVLYTLTNVAYFTVLSPTEMAATKAVAYTFMEKTVGSVSLVVPLFVACSTIGSLNGAIFGGSRYYFTAARDELFPSIMSTLQVKYLTPWPALFSVTLISILYVVTGEAIALLEYLGFAATLILLSVVLCLLYCRWKRPDIERPVKVHITIPVVCSVMLGGLLVLSIYQEPVKKGIATLLISTGVPVYYVMVKWTSRWKYWKTLVCKCTCVLQKCFLLVPADKDK